jgi:hypothetical protein
MTRDLAAYNAVPQVTTLPAQRAQYLLRFATAGEVSFMAMDFDPAASSACRCTFYGGTLGTNDQLINPASGAVIGAAYAPDPGVAVTGSIANGTITFSVPASQVGMGTKRPIFSVSAFVQVGPTLPDGLNPMRTLDASRPLDLTI